MFVKKKNPNIVYDIRNIIEKKKDGKELNKEEIDFFIKSYQENKITEAQAAAVIVLMSKNGLTSNEIYNLAVAMAETGEINENISQDDNLVELHSIGIVGDKVSILLIPILLSFDIYVYQIAKRGIGIFGNIIDKVESIPGFSTNFDIQDAVNNKKACIISKPDNISNIEDRMRSLRGQIACLDSVPLMVASMMSIKYATGIKKIMFNIEYGKGGSIKTKEAARNLSNLLNIIGNKMKKDVSCVIINTDEPLGKSVGNILEIEEIIGNLRGNMNDEVLDSVLTIGSNIMKLTEKYPNLKYNRQIIQEAIDNGNAYKTFLKLISMQNGDANSVESRSMFKKAKLIMPVYSQSTGIVREINSELIGSVSLYVGGGRKKLSDEIDKTAGIVLEKKVGDKVESGEIIAYIHTNKEDCTEGAVNNIEKAFLIM